MGCGCNKGANKIDPNPEAKYEDKIQYLTTTQKRNQTRVFCTGCGNGVECPLIIFQSCLKKDNTKGE